MARLRGGDLLIVCKRCGGEFVENGATEEMLEYNLCILCIMEWHRIGEGSLNEFADKKRDSHFKM